VLQSRAGSQQQVTLLSPLTGRIVRRVTFFGGSLTGNGMALSPDSRFVYVTLSGPGQIHIDRISVATGHRSFVADGAQPAVSPDGRYLAYATGRQFTGIAVRDLLSGRTTMITLRNQLGADASLLPGQQAGWATAPRSWSCPRRTWPPPLHDRQRRFPAAPADGRTQPAGCASSSSAWARGSHGRAEPTCRATGATS
jgi:hypothetical protein